MQKQNIFEAGILQMKNNNKSHNTRNLNKLHKRKILITQAGLLYKSCLFLIDDRNITSLHFKVSVTDCKTNIKVAI